MGKLDKTETLVTIGDMTYIREVTETDFVLLYVIVFPIRFSLHIF